MNNNDQIIAIIKGQMKLKKLSSNELARRVGVAKSAMSLGERVIYLYLNLKAYIIGVHVVFRSIYLYINCHQTATRITWWLFL